VLPFDAECVGVDGHALGHGRSARYSRPYRVPAGVPFEFSSAQRYDLLVEPDEVGVHTVRFHFRDWIRGTTRGVAETTLTVSD